MKSIKYLKKFTLIACIILFPSLIFSQHYSSTDLDSDFFQERVKNIEDFINRFNYSQDSRGNLLNYSDSLKNTRANDILKLFSDSIINENFKTDSLGRIITKVQNVNIIESFISNVALDKSPLFMDITKGDCVAEAKCLVKYKGKENNITLLMSLVYEGDNIGYVWVIDSCNAKFLDITPTENIIISPVSHNLNFMDLGKLSKRNPDDFSSTANLNFTPDHLSILFFLIKTRQLTIEYVTDLSFHFTQIKGYKFTVKNIKSNHPHSGWLITELDYF